jgi:hypothetical protein
MKFALLVSLAVAAFPAYAQAPSQFRMSAPLTIAGGDALHLADVPFEVYREARKDLADVRIFNAAGESVPFAWAGQSDPVLEVTPPIALPIFPVSRLDPVTSGTGAEVTVRAADGTLVSVRGATTRMKTVARPAAWLLDASRATEDLRALALQWNAGPGAEMVTVRVEASDDLKAWRTLAAAPLVRLESEGRVLVQPRVEFTPQKAKYYRLTADAPTFALDAVRGEHVPRGRLPDRQVRSVPASPGTVEGEHVYDVGARLPVEVLRLLPHQDNAVVSATILARDDPKAPWRMVARAGFYRLKRDGTEVSSPPIDIGRRAARYWMARLDPGSSAGAPTLEVQWRAHGFVFVAQGEPPFHLAFGNPQAAATALPLTTLVPQYERGKERRLAFAKVGEVRAGPPPSRWDNLVGSLNPRRIALWAILVGGVIALGVMAWKLSRQMSRP